MPTWPARLLSSPPASSTDAPHSVPISPPLNAAEKPTVHPSSPPTSAPPPPPSRRAHSRSISHPFPSLFGGSKRSDKRIGRELFLDSTDDEAAYHVKDLRSNSPQKQSLRAPPSEELVTGKCMTCDSNVRWPRTLKVFRCTICLMINDLEPFLEPRTLHGPSNVDVTPGPQSQKQALPVSIERTRAIIDRCLSSYLQSHLDGPEARQPSPNPTADIPRRRSASETHQRSRSCNLNRSELRTPSPLAGSRGSPPPDHNTSSSRVSSTSNSRQGDSLSVPHGDGAASWIDQSPNEGEGKSGSGRSASIFRPLENYIVASFNGCDCMNNSFVSVRSHVPRTASDPTTNLGGDTVSTSLSNAPVSELDAKTLLLSDIAENGSWWSGSRTHCDRSNDVQRNESFDVGRGLVSSKTPRINWVELAEWYQLILHAGESWIDKWSQMKPTETQSPEESVRSKRWDETRLEVLEQEISESRHHARRTLLMAAENLLKRPKRPLKRPEDVRFLLILLANPLLYAPSVGRNQPSMSSLSAPKHGGRSRSEDTTPLPQGYDPSAGRKRSLSTRRATGGPNYHSGIIKRILGLLSGLPNECNHLLVSWFSRFSDSHFQRIVNLIGSFVTYRLTRQHGRRQSEPPKPGNGLVPRFSSPGGATSAKLHAALRSANSARSANVDNKQVVYGEDWQIRAAARVMSLLFAANNTNHARKRDGTHFDAKISSTGLATKYDAYGHWQIVPISSFYNTLLDYSDVVADFDAWELRGTKFSFCQHPFFLSIWAKIRILEHEARRQMEIKAREAFFDSILGRKAVSQYLVLKVRRDCLVEDSFSGVSEVVGSGQEEFKKGLRIEFLGEEGVDAGGLRKEWFLLLVREIFDPDHGLFVYDEDSQYCYFNPYCFESSEQFFLVGVLLGLAIYNSTILDVALPPFAFRKLLASAPPTNAPAISAPRPPLAYTLDDLAEYRPALAKGLWQLLEYEGDVQETFCREFVIQMDRYGQPLEYPLCPGGETRPVTNSNRREFVDLYVQYLLDTAVSRQFEPFKRGFFTVCRGNALSLFQPGEIELLVRGSDEALDIASLRAVAIYEHWPVPNPEREPVVNWFWDFFASTSPKDQRKILSFITGSDRIPAMGTTNLMIRLVCLGQDSERFPTARTCFNLVALYRYKSREKLEEKLWRAVVDSEGFGLK